MEGTETEPLPSLPFNSTELGQERFGYQYSVPDQVMEPPLPQPPHDQLSQRPGGGGYLVHHGHETPGYGGAYNYPVQQQQQQQQQQPRDPDQRHYELVAASGNGWEQHPNGMWIPNVSAIPSGYG